MSISRVERVGLVGVTAIAAVGADPGRPDPALLSGSTRQRHEARVGHQYAAAQYAAQQRFVGEQRTRYPDGNMPSVRAYARESEPAARAAATPAATLAQVRSLVELHASSTITDSEFAKLVAGLFDQDASAAPPR
ncbi:MAG: hypothetical protein KDC46_00140 [Thermoleophilia bacterium]|nr:hypothetical protein [Thermoleophilia bacterium]